MEASPANHLSLGEAMGIHMFPPRGGVGRTSCGLFSDEQDFVDQYNDLVHAGVDWRDYDYRMRLKTCLARTTDLALSNEMWQIMTDFVETEHTVPTHGYPYDVSWARVDRILPTRFPDYYAINPSIHAVIVYRGEETTSVPAIILMEQQGDGTSICALASYNNLVGGSLLSPTKYFHTYRTLGRDEAIRSFVRGVVRRRNLIESTTVADDDGVPTVESPPQARDDWDVWQRSRFNVVSLIPSAELGVVNLTMMREGYMMFSCTTTAADIDLLDHPLISSLLQFVGCFSLLDFCADGHGTDVRNRVGDVGHFLTFLYYPRCLGDERRYPCGEGGGTIGRWTVLDSMRRASPEGSMPVRCEMLTSVARDLTNGGSRCLVVSFPIFPPLSEDGHTVQGLNHVSDVMLLLAKMSTYRTNTEGTGIFTLSQLLDVLDRRTHVLRTPLRLEAMARLLNVDGHATIELSEALRSMRDTMDRMSHLRRQRTELLRGEVPDRDGKHAVAIRQRCLRCVLDLVQTWDAMVTACVHRLLFLGHPGELVLIRLAFVLGSLATFRCNRTSGLSDDGSVLEHLRRVASLAGTIGEADATRVDAAWRSYAMVWRSYMGSLSYYVLGRHHTSNGRSDDAMDLTELVEDMGVHMQKRLDDITTFDGHDGVRLSTIVDELMDTSHIEQDLTHLRSMGDIVSKRVFDDREPSDRWGDDTVGECLVGSAVAEYGGGGIVMGALVKRVCQTRINALFIPPPPSSRPGEWTPVVRLGDEVLQRDLTYFETYMRRGSVVTFDGMVDIRARRQLTVDTVALAPYSGSVLPAVVPPAAAGAPPRKKQKI